MTEIHKPVIRQRPIDNAKPLQLVKDINEMTKSADLSEKKEFNFIEKEINNILELYDKKKTIIIPKAEKIDQPGASSSSGGNNFSSEKKTKDSAPKEYEASRHDVNFLNFENNFMTLNELEKVIITLENDIGSGEPIPNDRVRELIVGLYPEKTQHANKLTKFFYTRREDYKKSLLRKYWKEQKTTDQFLLSTYRKRDREKMKTRRNKQNEFESLNKLKEIKDTIDGSLFTMFNSMRLREEWKKHLLQTNHFIFREEEAIARGDKGLLNANEEKWQAFSKEIGRIVPNEKVKQVDNTIIPSTSPQSTSVLTVDKQEVPKPTNHAPTRIRPKKVEKVVPVVNPKVPLPSPHYQHHKKEEIPKEKKKEIRKKEEQKPVRKPEKYLKLRLRINRANQLVIDRYIQKKNSFSPFDDSITHEINRFKIIDEDFTYHTDKEANFDSLYDEYLKEEMNNFCFISDSDEDNASFQNQIKSFQNSHRQFLKQKRGHN